MDEKIIIQKIYKYCKTIIDKGIFLFVFVFFKKMFLISSGNINYNNKIDEKLKEWIEYINKKIIQKEEKYIKEEYTKQNISNIFALVVSQNRIYASEIIEGILIYIFSMAFIADKDITLNKYIFKNISNEFESHGNLVFESMIDISKFKPKEIRNIRQLLLIDFSGKDVLFFSENYNVEEEVLDSEIYNILYDILCLKFSDIIIKELKIPNKIINYINKYIYNIEKQYKVLYYLEKSQAFLEYNYDYNEHPLFLSEFYYEGKLDIGKRVPLRMLRSFLIATFIYYVNKTSPLIKYIKPFHKKEENKDLVHIPFEYNLEGAYIKEKYSNIIISPLRFEPRITEINLGKNIIKRYGLFELGKLLIFNKNIKYINLELNNLTDNCLEYLNFGMRIHENHTLEELILSNNFLKTQSGITLAKIITYLRELKTLNLCNNEFKWGLSSLFAILKKLYRKGKTKLECLKLNNCKLDDESFYELGELISSKFCKLKKLYLRSNYNNVDLSFFLKKLKKNNSITEIYLGHTLIYNNNVNEILRIISNTKIKHLYLDKVNIKSFIELLRIIYRTKIIKEKGDEYINKNESSLINLDLSNNDICVKTPKCIKLLAEVIENSTIRCLDISHIIYGFSPENFNTKLKNNKYIIEVEKLKQLLEEKKRICIQKKDKINKYKVDIERNKSLEKEEKFNELELENIIKNKYAEYPLFLRKESNKIINDKFKDIKDLNKRKDMETKLIQYMTLKKAKYELNILEQEIKDKKLIII